MVDVCGYVLGLTPVPLGGAFWVRSGLDTLTNSSIMVPRAGRGRDVWSDAPRHWGSHNAQGQLPVRRYTV
jgi:hypothetical protein